MADNHTQGHEDGSETRQPEHSSGNPVEAAAKTVPGNRNSQKYQEPARKKIQNSFYYFGTHSARLFKRNYWMALVMTTVVPSGVILKSTESMRDFTMNKPRPTSFIRFSSAIGLSIDSNLNPLPWSVT